MNFIAWVMVAAIAAPPCPEALEVVDGQFYAVRPHGMEKVAPCDGIILSMEKSKKLADTLDRLTLEKFEAERNLLICKAEAEGAESRASGCAKRLQDLLSEPPVVVEEASTAWWAIALSAGAGMLVGAALAFLFFPINR